MYFQSALPAVILRPYIKRYWAVENLLDTTEVHIQRVIATGLPELTFYSGERPVADKRCLDENTVVSGQQNDYYDLRITGGLSVFSVTFQANGLSHFLKIPINELHNRTIGVSALDKSFFGDLEIQLATASCFQTRMGIVENYFVRLLVRRSEHVNDRRLAHSIALIKSSRGHAGIDRLADEACLSRKQYERIFLSHIGITPGQFLRIIRFQHAIHLHQGNLDLTGLAYEAGYYDQSHFIKEIKAFSGQLPKHLFRNSGMVSDFFI